MPAIRLLRVTPLKMLGLLHLLITKDFICSYIALMCKTTYCICPV